MFEGFKNYFNILILLKAYLINCRWIKINLMI